MGKTMKFEIEIPDFKEELSINITLQKDGKVVYDGSATPSSGDKGVRESEENTIVSVPAVHGGNMMNNLEDI